MSDNDFKKYAVALKATSDILRHTLGVDRRLDTTAEQEMPELVLRIVTDEDASAMAKLVSDDAALIES